MSTPNLDAMSQEELCTFWNENHVPTPQQAVDLVGPIGTAGGGYPGAVDVVENVAVYAINKACAMGCRLDGNIQGALVYESVCDGLYEDFPESVKW